MDDSRRNDKNIDSFVPDTAQIKKKEINKIQAFAVSPCTPSHQKQLSDVQGKRGREGGDDDNGDRTSF